LNFLELGVHVTTWQRQMSTTETKGGQDDLEISKWP
jgi:hypothetical protein